MSLSLAADKRSFHTQTLETADGYQLVAQRYLPSGPVRARLIVAGATGVQQQFYRRFARFARLRGYDTLTLDYRGVGLSAPAELRGFRMNYLDWGQQDLAAAVKAMHGGGCPLYLLGHSYGGHALGLLPNHELIDACFTFGTGSGWHGWMPTFEGWRVRFLLNMVGPLLTRWYGYLPLKRLNMGENLPLDVYRQWKHWCRYPRYFFEDSSLPELAQRFAQVRLPILAANAVDDSWASPGSRDAFMPGYQNAPWQGRDIQPHSFGMAQIGHMGYFRATAQPLWVEALDWLSQQPQRYPQSPQSLAA